MTTTERRQHARTTIRLSATIERVGGRPLSGEASTIDLSEGGARLEAPAGFAVGDVVRVTISGDDVSADHRALVVARKDGKGGKATIHVAFQSMDDGRRIDLRRLLERV